MQQGHTFIFLNYIRGYIIFSDHVKKEMLINNIIN